MNIKSYLKKYSQHKVARIAQTNVLVAANFTLGATVSPWLALGGGIGQLTYCLATEKQDDEAAKTSGNQLNRGFLRGMFEEAAAIVAGLAVAGSLLYAVEKEKESGAPTTCDISKVKNCQPGR